MKVYEVRWVITEEAGSPEEAAEMADQTLKELLEAEWQYEVREQSADGELIAKEPVLVEVRGGGKGVVVL